MKRLEKTTHKEILEKYFNQNYAKYILKDDSPQSKWRTVKETSNSNQIFFDRGNNKINKYNSIDTPYA